MPLYRFVLRNASGGIRAAYWAHLDTDGEARQRAQLLHSTGPTHSIDIWDGVRLVAHTAPDGARLKEVTAGRI
jgi:hypothetical protein